MRCLHLGEAIRAYRLKQNLSQLQLATQSGIAAHSIQRIEAGGIPNFDTLVRIVKGLGMTVPTLFRFVDIDASIDPAFQPEMTDGELLNCLNLLESTATSQ